MNKQLIEQYAERMVRASLTGDPENSAMWEDILAEFALAMESEKVRELKIELSRRNFPDTSGQ